MPDQNHTPDDADATTEVGEFTDGSPFQALFGNESKARIIDALLAAPEPLNPSRIIERAGISSTHGWYSNKEDLFATGLVVETGKAGNSPLYKIDDSDPRVEALHKLRDVTSDELDKNGYYDDTEGEH